MKFSALLCFHSQTQDLSFVFTAAAAAESREGFIHETSLNYLQTSDSFFCDVLLTSLVCPRAFIHMFSVF